MSAHSGALEAVDRILNRGGADDEVLRAVLAVLHERAFAFVAVTADAENAPLRVPVRNRGVVVAWLHAKPRRPSPDDLPLLERVALLVSAHVGAAPVRCPT